MPGIWKRGNSHQEGGCGGGGWKMMWLQRLQVLVSHLDFVEFNRKIELHFNRFSIPALFHKLREVIDGICAI